MSIPESQLETWSHQGAVKTAKATHESIRNALDSYKWPNEVDCKPYLQGSYKNDTNIFGDMDVDVVVQLNSLFYSNLSEEQRRNLGLYPASYGWTDFRLDILKALREYYDPKTIAEGNKSIKLKATPQPADVVVCVQYREYRSLNIDDYTEGMTFWTKNDDRQVKNYPKIHYDNGIKKNQNTNNQFKPIVRIFKNMRNLLRNRNYISNDLTPSYFLECLLYNIPNEKFIGSYQEMVHNILSWLNNASLSSFMCQNNQLKLFGNTPEQWSEHNAKQFTQSLIDLWTRW